MSHPESTLSSVATLSSVIGTPETSIQIQNSQRNKIIRRIKQAKNRQQIALRDGDLDEYTEQRGIALRLRRSLDPNYQGVDGLDPCL